MTRSKPQMEILKLLEEVPEDRLREILDILKDWQAAPSDEPDFIQHLRQILMEDHDLLEKLAPRSIISN